MVEAKTIIRMFASRAWNLNSYTIEWSLLWHSVVSIESSFVTDAAAQGQEPQVAIWHTRWSLQHKVSKSQGSAQRKSSTACDNLGKQGGNAANCQL